jgi:hypothetical protein
MVEDRRGRKYVTALTIIKFGTPFSIIAALLIMTLGYGLTLAVF